MDLAIEEEIVADVIGTSNALTEKCGFSQHNIQLSKVKCPKANLVSGRTFSVLGH